MSDRVGEVLEAVTTYTDWWTQAWRDQAAKVDQAAKSSVAQDPTKVVLDGVALGITSVIKAGIAAMNSVAIVALLDRPGAGAQAGYHTDSAAGVRQVAIVGDFTHAETGDVMPGARVSIHPTTLQDGETGYLLTCPLGDGFGGPYMGTVSVTEAGAEIESMTVFIVL